VKKTASSPRSDTGGVRCPTCGRPTGWTENPQRPFCSITCRLIDLGVWLDEGYRVPADDGPVVSDVP
jgi:hypothetical protein